MKLIALRVDPTPGGAQVSVFLHGEGLADVQADGVKQLVEDMARLILEENVQVVAEVVVLPEPEHPPQADGDSVLPEEALMDLFEKVKSRVKPYQH